MRPHLIEPAVPVADREALVNARPIFSGFTLGRDAPVVFVVHRARIDAALKENRFSVGAELRAASAGRERSHAARLASGHDIDDVNLVDLVVFAPGGTGDHPAVVAPGRAALAAFGECQTSRLCAPVGGNDP